ncbi:ComEA family DNA-binding protein [Photobacterium sanguinicancri]|uniref:ComEA family DNA-binding protein n=1 Tax=Photobacterium sanguinicancri TaxID=875932 RepID=UPI0026E2E3DE|nr:helix-hairpin-helix domain-containing protein [Photobacterium sanguinicancri]MDO6499570.1 helix-hairpin-helix domain-containing protein [Photobacterium sanguinicancri]
MKRLLISVFLCGAALVASQASANDSHDGIEITININDANAEELDKLLIGIGPEKAESIILYRNEHGEFQTADELAGVKGIGLATVEKNRERIKL